MTTVVLSFGLNNRNPGNTTLLKKDLYSMLEATEATFSQAKVLINFSEDLLENIKTIIKTLNHLIKDKYHDWPRNHS